MSVTINPSASLATAQTKLQTVLQALGSGNALTSASDNPAGLSQVSSYSVQLSGDAQAINNAQDSINLLDTANGANDQIAQNLQDLRALAVQAGDGALNAGDLKTIQQQYNQLSQGIDDIAGSTQFNGQNLLDGSFSGLTVQAGPNAGDTKSLALAGASSAALGVAGADLSSASGRASALDAIDKAIGQVNDQRINIGSFQAGLTATADNLGTAYVNTASAKSQVSDTDYAKASSALAQSQVQQQASLRAVALYNENQKSVLSLLPSER